MPKGLSGVREAVADREARRSAAAGGGTLWFKLGSGESATVRFLEQGDDVHWVWTHQLPPQEGQKWGIDTPCLDQASDGSPCPGCEKGLKRKFKGYINVIWRDAPKYKRNEDGFYEKEDGNLVQIGTEDALAVWNSGINVFEELDGKDATYKGLSSRDFVIKRKGKELNTKYTIDPADPDGGPQDISAADKKLFEEKKDLNELTQPLEYDEFKRKLNGDFTDNSSGGTTSEEPEDGPDGGDVNPFLRK